MTWDHVLDVLFVRGGENSFITGYDLSQRSHSGMGSPVQNVSTTDVFNMPMSSLMTPAASALTPATAARGANFVTMEPKITDKHRAKESVILATDSEDE